MNNQEAKFIFGAYRPDGRDAGDAIFAEPLAQAARDPELRDWLENQQKIDAAIADKLHAIAPPPGLRESILAGVRASQPRRRDGHAGWWAAAAAIVVLAGTAWSLKPSPGSPTAAQFTAMALSDLASSHDDHVGRPSGLERVQDNLITGREPLTQTMHVDADELRAKGCRTVRVAGRDVFELCFWRDGVVYHLYVGRRSDFAPGLIDPHALLATRGAYAATAWADARNVYALVTEGPAEALRRVL